MDYIPESPSSNSSSVGKVKRNGMDSETSGDVAPVDAEPDDEPKAASKQT
jgi:hypothetical protein